MKILLDEGVPKVIQRRLTKLSISNVEDMGWRGIRNGALLDQMAGQFQVLITADKRTKTAIARQSRSMEERVSDTNRCYSRAPKR